MAEEFKVIESQEQLDAVLKGRLEREKVKYTDQIAELTQKYEAQVGDSQKQITELTQALNAFKEEKENFSKSLAERDAKIKEYELSSVKTQVAHELGLAYEAVNFIQGADEAEIRQSAEALKGLVNVKTAPLAVVEPDVKNSAEATKDAALRQMSRDLQKL